MECFDLDFQMCVTQSNKLSKLESERQEWQRRIIEAEREKRVTKKSSFLFHLFLMESPRFVNDCL